MRAGKKGFLQAKASRPESKDNVHNIRTSRTEATTVPRDNWSHQEKEEVEPEGSGLPGLLFRVQTSSQSEGLSEVFSSIGVTSLTCVKE